MKKEILLISYLFLFGFCLNGQSTFVKTLGGAGEDIAHSAIETSDGNYLVIGSTTSFGSGGSDGFISKINGSAKEIWDKTIGGSGDDVFRNGIQLSNGDFILVGWTASFGNGGKDILVTRVNNFGTVIWSQTFGGIEDEIAYSVMETSDGNILVAGYTVSFGSGSLDVFIVKMTQNGDEIWSNAYGTPAIELFYGEGLIEDSAGNYVLTGTRDKGGNPDPYDGFFMKLDSDGNIRLLKAHGGDRDEGLEGHLREVANGFQSISATWSWNNYNHGIWMTDMTFDGDINWSKLFGLPGKNIRIGYCQFTSDGNYLISGHEFTEHTNATGDAILLKVSTDGEILWAKSYSDFGIETLDVVFETNDGVLAFGKTTSYGQGGNDIFVVRTDEFGTVSGCSETLSLTTTNVVPESNEVVFAIENQTLGEPQILDVSNIEYVESVVCDGCNADDLVAGFFCSTAPIICSIDCLDGFTGTLPDELLMPQPDPLCNGGNPNNVSWFAFVAGSNTLDLTIIPSNCDTTINAMTGLPATTGVQAGIYADCSFESSLVCKTDVCGNLVVEDVNLFSDQFIEGQIYYLFVDGCGGSVCDYEVVVNSAQQAFSIDEITSISNNLGIDIQTDTLCQGTEIVFSIDDYEQIVEFNWSIDPPTVDYPSGVNTAIDSTSVTFQFNEEGCFDVRVYAFNECDISETQTFNVCVKPLEDEYFSDISVCQECFPINLITPESGCIITAGGGPPTVLIEDPNADGVPGWFGSDDIMGPGLDSNLVTTSFGCSYYQYVNVIELPISPREQIDYYFCDYEFPVDIDGFTFDNPGDSRNITLDGQSSSGCDSLISITAHGIDIFGFSNIGSCESNEIELSFEPSIIEPENYDSLTYIWYDESLNIVTDDNGIDSILVVSGVGSFSVQVTVYIGDASCMQTFGPFLIDIDNLVPATPNVTYFPFEICTSELEAQIYVGNQGLAENYIWTLTPNLPFTSGLTSDTIYVDVTSGQSFEFCVHAMNGCGISDEICEDVVVNDSPDSEFDISDEICIDSFVTIQYVGAFGNTSSSIFNWDFDGGTIMNAMDPNSGGPFEIGFSNTGVYTIGLVLQEAGCNSILTEYNVTVGEPFSPPTIDCEGQAGSVVFSWDDTGVESYDITILTGQTSFEIIDNTFVVSDLGSEEDVSIQIIFNHEDICNGSIAEGNCTSLPCPDVILDISLSDQNICLEEDLDIVLGISIEGDNSGVGIWESPFIYNDNSFDVSEAGVGTFPITYAYTLGDCTYTEDSILIINGSPTVDVDITISFCEEMGSSFVDIITEMGNTVLLDGVLISELNNVEISAGDHLINVMNDEGCDAAQNITVDSIGVADLMIVGSSKIIMGEIQMYTASLNTDLDDLVLVWTMDGDTICVDCSEVAISPDMDTELCVTVSYGDGCLLEDCLQIEIGEQTELYIPNVFSPNNDNVNDIFTVNSNSSDVFIVEIMIFDRWGEIVYNQKGFNVGEESSYWDGSFNGSMCLSGVYVYMIKYIDEENQEKVVSGDLTLIQ